MHDCPGKTLQQTLTHAGGELDSLRVDHFRIDGDEAGLGLIRLLRARTPIEGVELEVLPHGAQLNPSLQATRYHGANRAGGSMIQTGGQRMLGLSSDFVLLRLLLVGAACSGPAPRSLGIPCAPQDWKAESEDGGLDEASACFQISRCKRG